MSQALERKTNYALRYLRRLADYHGKVVLDRKKYYTGKPTDPIRWAVREFVNSMPDENPAKRAIKTGSLKVVIHKDGDIGEIYKR